MALTQKIPFRVFYDEKDFLKNLLSTITDFSRLIVYNSAQNGIGPGRKALIPSICKYFGIRYTGSDPYRVCLCRDKYAINAILSKAGFKVPQSVLYCPREFPSLCTKKKYIAKPLYESSSLGIRDKNVFIGENAPFSYLKDLSTTMKQPLLIQEFISGYELEVPVLVGEKSIFSFPPVVLHRKNGLIMGDEILDYDKIYNDDYYFGDLPIQYDCGPICQTAEKVAEILCLKGLCRIDFRMKENGEFYITDVSTNPHFIHHSSVNYAFLRYGLTDSDIFSTILSLS